MDLSEWLASITWATVGKDLSTGFVGALLGAWGGAFAAQRIAERGKRRNQLIDEIRCCNEALDLLHGVCSTFINVKAQYTEPMRTRYRLQRSRVIWLRNEIAEGRLPPSTVIDAGEFDLQVRMVPLVQIGQIERVLLEKMSITGRARTLVGVLHGSYDTFKSLVSSRNEWISRFQAAGASMSDTEKATAFLSLPTAVSRDETYMSFVEGIYNSSDDCIAFAEMISALVRKHGLETRRAYFAEFSGDIPRVGQLDLSDVEVQGLMPDKANYADWYKVHPSSVPVSRGRRGYKIWYRMRCRYRAFNHNMGWRPRGIGIWKKW